MAWGSDIKSQSDMFMVRLHLYSSRGSPACINQRQAHQALVISPWDYWSSRVAVMLVHVSDLPRVCASSVALGVYELCGRDWGVYMW